MRRIDVQFLETPFFGARQMARWLRRQGYDVNRKRVGRLMRKMGLSAIYQKPNTSKPFPGHKIYPYLLKAMTIDTPNQVWCADVLAQNRMRSLPRQPDHDNFLLVDVHPDETCP